MMKSGNQPFLELEYFLQQQMINIPVRMPTRRERMLEMGRVIARERLEVATGQQYIELLLQWNPSMITIKFLPLHNYLRG